MIVWVRDASWRRAATALPLRTRAVESGYEALAELLAGPVAALVVELSLLSPRHVRLLEVARSRRVEVLGLGGPHPNVRIETLSGVRLVSPHDLAVVTAPMAPAPASEPAWPAAVAPADPLAGFVADEPALRDVVAASQESEHEVAAEADGGIEEEVDEELIAAIEADRNAAQGRYESAAPVAAPPTGNGSDNGNGQVLPAEKSPAAAEALPTEQAAPSPRGLLSRDELSALLEDAR